MAIFFFKAFHIIGFVSWFAGLFYLVRMFVYHREALNESEPKRGILIEEYRNIEQRVFKIIANPAMHFTWFCGITMFVLNPGYLEQGWLQVKLFFLLLLTGYHFYVKRFLTKLEDQADQFQPIHFRILNEIPTVFLVVIVSLAVFRQNINYWYLIAGVLLFTAMIAWGIIAYKKKRALENKGK